VYMFLYFASVDHANWLKICEANIARRAEKWSRHTAHDYGDGLPNPVHCAGGSPLEPKTSHCVIKFVFLLCERCASVFGIIDDVQTTHSREHETIEEESLRHGIRGCGARMGG